MIAIGAHVAFLILAVGMAVKAGLVLKGHGDVLGQEREGHAGIKGAGPQGARRLRSLGRLTLTGFSMVTAGAIALLLRLEGDPQTVIDGLAFLVTRIGFLLVVLGVTHFHCLSILSKASWARATVLSPPPAGQQRPRRAKEDPLDRVFEAARLDAPSGA